MKKIIEIPYTLDLDSILLEYPSTKKLIKDRLIYLIHLIYYMHILNPRAVMSGKTRLHSQILKKLIGRDYVDYVNYLVDSNIIKKSDHFSPGNTSYQYELANIIHAGVHPKNVEIEDDTLLKRIQKWEDEYYSISENVEKNYKFLRKWFNSKLIAEVSEDLLPHQKNKLEYINKNRFRMAIDPFGKRLHSNLTNLPKKLRKNLRYDGKPLVEVDIKNCQFYLVIKILINYIKLDCPELYKELIHLDNDLDKLELLKKSVDFGNIGLYIKDATSLEFYENIANEYSQKHNVKFTRDDVKEHLFKSIFSKSNYRSNLKILFKEMYPLVYEIIDYKKKNNKLKKDKHKAISKSLQQLESGLVLRNVCKNELLDNVPLFTIHDAILTTEEHVALVKDIIENTLCHNIYFKPNVEIEYYF